MGTKTRELTWTEKHIYNGPVGVVLGCLVAMYYVVFGWPDDFE